MIDYDWIGGWQLIEIEIGDLEERVGGRVEFGKSQEGVELGVLMEGGFVKVLIIF